MLDIVIDWLLKRRGCLDSSSYSLGPVATSNLQSTLSVENLKSLRKRWRKYNFWWSDPNGHASSATHRQTGWALHQRRWSNDACSTPQRRPRHELAWIWTDFLSEQCQATDFVETAGGRAVNDRDSLHNARARLKISSQQLQWQRNLSTVA